MEMFNDLITFSPLFETSSANNTCAVLFNLKNQYIKVFRLISPIPALFCKHFLSGNFQGRWHVLSGSSANTGP